MAGALADDSKMLVSLAAGWDLAKRLGNLKGRGVVLKEGQTLKDLYDERSKLYEQYAEITVDESGRDIQGTILALREQIGM